MPAKRSFGDYYLGLDIGTDSVGWAVTDRDYNILRFRGKAMWGIHLFDSGNTAEKRRTHRIARRRLERRKWRLKLLRELFEEEISKVDPLFFERLMESGFVCEDRKHKQHNSLFNDPSFDDKSLFKKYPTIYHLRNEMMTTKEKPDIRLVYLACHHIIKYRGHFLFENISSGEIPKFAPLLCNTIDVLNEMCDTEVSTDNTFEEIEAILLDKDLRTKEKTDKLSVIINSGDESKGVREFINLISGGTCKLREIFDPTGDSDELKDEKLKFSDVDWDAKRPELEDKVQEGIFLLDLAKQIYDWAALKKLLGESECISLAKIGEYDRHEEDLKLLKEVVRNYLGKEGYTEIFMNKSSADNYAAYSKSNTGEKACSQNAFCGFLKKNLETVFSGPDFETGEYRRMKNQILESTFMPKQTSKENGLLPNILHYKELHDILVNCSKWYSFLETEDGSGYTVSEKIEQLCKFRIPYYVGPLSPNAKHKWMVRKREGEILPWNFEELIDMEGSSEGFMNNLIGTCTYLPGEKVLPKNSILYSRFMLYNELNTLSIKNDRINVKLKGEIVRDLFENQEGPKKITKKILESYLRSRGLFHDDDEINGIDDDVKSNLKSEYQLKGILKDKYKIPLAEEIIRSIVVFGDDRKRLKSKLFSDYSGLLSKDEIEKLSSLQFKGWGRLSEKFLLGIRAQIDGNTMNILTALEQTNLNLNEIIRRHDYSKQINFLKNEALGINTGKITYDLLKDLYVSPPVKRGIWRTLRIIEDILEVTGHPPTKVFIETTREAQESKRTISRKTSLMKLYEACKEDEWVQQIKGEDEGRFSSKKLYSYYCQHGQCMYCGTKIDLNDLEDANKYDMDHIIPKSKKTDDSIHNNLVLVCKNCNSFKSDVYPIRPEIQQEMGPIWKSLLDCKLITKEKYARLNRQRPLSEDELSEFIARQLVETSQSVKAVADTLKRVFGDKSEIVYVKGRNVSDFRNNKGYVKCRSVNDHHHAKDAYLNIVVGNVYHVRFTSDPRRNIIERGEKYTLDVGRIFDRDVERNGEHAWTPGETGSIFIVNKYMRRENILFTRFSYRVGGQLFDLTPMKKGKGQHPLKEWKKIDKYGGYNKVAGSYYSLVEHTHKKERIRSLESVPIMINSEKVTDGELEGYFTSNGMVDPKIIFHFIRMNSTFELNGFRVHIRGRTGDNIEYIGAEQLILPSEIYNYCKQLYNYNERSKEVKKSKKVLPAEYFKLTAENNLKTYDVLMDKFLTATYKPFLGRFHLTLQEKRDLFIGLTPEEQSAVLNEILHGFQCAPTKMNLELIGESSQTGMIRAVKRVSSLDSIKLINQSPSGLFETEIDLKKI